MNKIEAATRLKAASDLTSEWLEDVGFTAPKKYTGIPAEGNCVYYTYTAMDLSKAQQGLGKPKTQKVQVGPKASVKHTILTYTVPGKGTVEVFVNSNLVKIINKS